MRPVRDTFCSYCGTAYASPLAYPRTCAHCKTTVWANPVPVSVVLVPVQDAGRTGLLVVRRAIEPAAVDREVARRIAGAFLLLVRRVVLLVDHDQPEPGQRCKNRQSCAEHDVGLPKMGQQPMLQTLHRRQAAVHGHHPIAWKTIGKSSLKLRREVDLGHQNQRLTARGQHLLGGMQINLGFATAGDPVQQHRLGRRLAPGGLESRQRSQLLGRQIRTPRRSDGLRHGTRGELLGQPGQTLVQPGRIEFAKRRRQHRQSQLADTALVIAGRKIHQRQPGGRHRWQRIENLAHRPQRVVGLAIRDGHFRQFCRRNVPDDAQQLPLAQWRAQQGTRRAASLAEVVECSAQSTVRRGVHRHPQHHGRWVGRHRRAGHFVLQIFVITSRNRAKSMIKKKISVYPRILWITLWKSCSRLR